MNNLVQFLHICVQSAYNFVSKISKMLQKIKTDVNRLLLVLIMKTNFPIYFAKIELFFQI